MQHGYKTQHSTSKTLHTLNNPVRTITVALDMSKVFDTIYIHTLIRKLLQTNIPDTIIKFMANYIKGREAYTTYRNHISRQRQLKTGVPQGGVLSPTVFNMHIQTYHHPVHRFRSWPTQTTSPSHPHTKARVQPRNTYNHTYRKFCLDKTKQSHTKSRQNKLYSVHAGPCIIYEHSGPQTKQQCTTHGNAPKGSGSYFKPKTHIQHTHPQHLSTRTQTSTYH